MTKHAQLPPHLVETAILSNMEIGDECWTVPWAMWVDMDNKCWLHPQYSTHKGPGGTAQMKVVRTRDGYGVLVPRGERYQPRPVPGYCSPEDTEYIPVAFFI